MFSQKLAEIIPHIEKIGALPLISISETRDLLEKCISGKHLDTQEVVLLMNGMNKPEIKAFVLEFAVQYKRPHRQEILLLPPLYFTSICENKCLYCDFSSGGARLSHEEFGREFDRLLDLGYRSIELVSSQDPLLFKKSDKYKINEQYFQIDPIAEYFKIARDKLDARGGGMLTSNIPPVDADSFRKLKTAGLNCYLLWLETFNASQYSKLHNPEGPKSDQNFRLDSFDKAAEAEIEHNAGAFLKGLYDWRKEQACLYLFDRHLKARNAKGFSIIGTPRLKGPFARSHIVQPYFVSDEDYELNIALDHILYDGVLWLQTRESPQYNDYLMDKYGAGNILTLDCSTAPGGYSGPPKAKAQFPVHRQNLKKAVAALESKGYHVHFQWDIRTLHDFMRKHPQ